MTFHLVSKCMIPSLDSIRWYFSLMCPFLTTSARLISTYPNDSCVENQDPSSAYAKGMWNSDNMIGGLYLKHKPHASSPAHDFDVDEVLHGSLVQHELELLVPIRISSFLDSLWMHTFDCYMKSIIVSLVGVW